MKKIMEIGMIVGITIFAFGLLVCIFIDIPKVWVVLPAAITIGSYLAMVHYERREKQIKMRRMRRSSKL